MTKRAAISLLSGGLDSVVSLVVALDSYDVKLVLFFNYGQRSLENETKAVKNICQYYKIPYKVINLDWLKEITATSLVNKDKLLPEYTVDKLNSSMTVLKDSAKAVWVPNRNGVMLSIGAAFAESLGYKFLIFGANLEESATFPDNSEEYVSKLSETFSYSTSNAVEIVVPLANKTKTEIVELALKYNVPLKFLWSCYDSGDKYCGKCESCARFSRALINNNQQELWKEMSSI